MIFVGLSEVAQNRIAYGAGLFLILLVSYLIARSMSS